MSEELCRARLYPGEQPGCTTFRRDEDGAGCDMSFDYAREGWGRGHQRTLMDADLAITVVDALTDRPMRAGFEMNEDAILVRATVESGCSYAQASEDRWRFARAELTVSFLPRGTAMEVLCEAGRPNTAVTMLVTPRSLMTRCGLRREDLPPPLLQVVDGQMRQAAPLFAMPVERSVASLVEDLVASRLPDRLAAMRIRARSMELVVLMAAAWNERLAAGADAGMRQRDAYLIEAARRILTQRLVDPPTLQELAHELGTNRNKLNQIFQRGLGVTPKAFCVQRRIERAQALLREGRMNVAQIAQTVGYQHQSSFATAFRDAVGVCPRDYGARRQVAPVAELAGA